MQYEIDLNLGRAEQVGLRFRCESESQAEKIHLLLRQENLKIDRLMKSFHEKYTHFIYVSGTEPHLREIMTKVLNSCQISTTARDTETLREQKKTLQTFKAWQSKFTLAVKKLNSDSFHSIAHTQEINANNLDETLELGRTSEIEQQLLEQNNHGNSSSLRTLITLYVQTDRPEQVVELWKYQRSKILALPVSGRLVEQLVRAHIQYSQQTNIAEAICSAQQIAQEFLPELERLRQANGVRQLLHQALEPQELPPTIIGATLNEQLVKLLEIEPGERIFQLESLYNKYPKAINVLITLAESYTAIGKIEEALKFYRSIPEQTEEIQFRQLSLLLDRGHFQDVLSQLPTSIERLSPILSGLRGIALYAVGERVKSRQFLEKAWYEDRNNLKVLLALARIWTKAGDPIQAGAAYQILQDSGDRLFRLEDYILITGVADSGGFGDISSKQKTNYYKKCIIESISYLLILDEMIKIFKVQAKLWLFPQDFEEVISAYSNWLDR